MKLARHMAAFWLAVIATIAVFGLPSSALAHQGHHGSHDHGASSHPPSTEVRHAPGATTDASRPVIARAVVADARVPGESSACAAPCCSWSGGHCCASGLVPEAGPIPFVDRSAGPPLAHDLPGRPGLVPEALPEPPKSFA